MRLKACSALLAGALVLGGCSGVPTSGPVERVSAAPGRLNPGVEIAPAPPGRNASPTMVVEGFLHAMASNQPSYAVARSYLTEGAADAWDPTAGVRIYGEGNPVVATEAGAILRAPVVGTVDAEGAYRQSEETIDHDFGLVQDEDGQWRIGAPPAGLLISEYLFTSAFTRVTPYFYAPEGRWLVPDPRFFPRGTSAYLGAARAVVGGATDWLAPAVDAPEVGVDVESVTVSPAGVATVTLTQPAGEFPEADQVALATQLAWSFRSFDSVVSLSVRWAGQDPWVVEPYGSSLPVTGFPEADPSSRQGSRQLFALSSGHVVRVIEGPDSTQHVSVAPGITDAAAAAVRPDALAVAAVSGDRTTLVLSPFGESVVTPVGAGAGFRRPQFDRHGSLWISDDAGGLWQVPPDGTLQPVAVTGVGEGSIEAYRVSPDGVRVALIVQRPGGQRALGLARVHRDGPEVIVDGWQELEVATTSVGQLAVLDVGWRAADSLLVLVADGRATTVQAVALDGSTIVPIGPTEAQDLVELAVAPGVPAMVRAAGGDVWRYNSDLRWSQHDTSLDAVIYP
ncbi:MAG: LpqB family beta-propeller domain-containing protein [Propionibacteriaceae bacterium]|nr:LpqB family beta-propeller domain-containing protein [Propionibacteriaceae bacterium]